MKTRNIAILLFAAALLLFCAVGSVSAAPTAVVQVPTGEVNVGETTTIQVVITSDDPVIGAKVVIPNTQAGVTITVNKTKQTLFTMMSQVNSEVTNSEQLIAFASANGITSGDFYLDVVVNANNVSSVPVNIAFDQIYSNGGDLLSELKIQNGVLKVVKNPVVSTVEVAVPVTTEYLVYGSTGTATAKVYDQYGTEMSVPVTWSSSNPDALAIDATGAYTVKSGAGDVTIIATAGTVTGEFTIALAKAELTEDDLVVTIASDNKWEQVYNGQPYEVKVAVNDDITGYGTIAVLYNGEKTAPSAKGNYKVVASISGGDNYEAAEIELGTLVIGNKFVAQPTVADLVYNGNAQTVTLPTSAEYTVVEADSVVTATAAGEYIVVFQLADSENTQWGGGDGEIAGDKLAVTWNIAPKSAAGLALSVTEQPVYMGGITSQSPTFVVQDGTTLLSSNDYEIKGETAGLAAGTYKVTIAGKNNYTGEQPATWSIDKAVPTIDDLTIDPAEAPRYTYDGKEHTVSIVAKEGIEGLGAITVKYNGATAAPVNANTYKVNASIAAGNNYTAAEIEVYTLEIVTMPKVDEKTVKIVGISSTVSAVSFNLTSDGNSDKIYINLTQGENLIASKEVLDVASAGSVTDVQFTVTSGQKYNVTITPLNAEVGAEPNVFTTEFTAPTVTSIELADLSASNIIDKGNEFEVTAPFNATVKDENGNKFSGEALTWTSDNPEIISVTADGIYTANAVGTANITVAVTAKTTVNDTIKVTVIDTTPVQPTLPTINEGTVEGEIIVDAGDATLEADNKTIILKGNGVDMTIVLDEEQDPSSTEFKGNTSSVFAQYTPIIAAPGAGLKESVSFTAGLNLINANADIPALSGTVNDSIVSKLPAEYQFAAMLTATSNVDKINANLKEGSWVSFTVPGAWYEAMTTLAYFHAEKDGIPTVKDIEAKWVTKNADGTYTIKVPITSFSSYGIVGKVETPVTPPAGGGGGGGYSGGSSTWVTQTPTPTPTETTTPTENVPTDVPTGQPTQTEASTPGFGALAALAGLGAVAVLRRK